VEVFFGTPAYDKTLSVDYNQSMVQSAVLLTKLGIELHHQVEAGNCFLGMTRNALVKAFLDSTATDLIFIDADVGWDARALPRLLAHEEEIVGGLVPKRDTTSESCYHQNALTGVVQNGLFQSLELPTAFMRIKRSAFDRLVKPYFRAESSEDEYGEDIYFCRRWCKAGGFLWVDADISFSHRGSRAWRGNFYDHCVSSGLLKRNHV
jgi:hypothetical protein